MRSLRPTGDTAVNLGLVAVSCLAAHLAPATTLLGAYAFMGPAHYLTEMSWLRDRGFFSPTKSVPFILAALGLVFVLFGTSAIGCAAIGMALALATAGAIRDVGPVAIIVAAALGASAGLLVHEGNKTLVIVAILVPTLVHVSGFTLAFMVRGSMRKGGSGSWLVVASVAAAIVSFAALPTAMTMEIVNPRILDDTFGPLARYLVGTGWKPRYEEAIGLLGFCYAYHYLNWFAKTGTIGWHKTTARRKEVMVAAWLAVTGAYLVDFRLGFILSLPLSVGHVFLEFPLNAQTLKGIATRGQTVSRPA